MSNFSEFHLDNESAGPIQFGESWIFANFVKKTAGCNFHNQLLFTAFCSSSWLDQGQQSEFSTYRVLSTGCKVSNILCLIQEDLLTSKKQ